MRLTLVAVALLGLALAGCADQDAQRKIEELNRQLAETKEMLRANSEHAAVLQSTMDKQSTQSQGHAGEVQELSRKSAELAKKNEELIQKLSDSVAAFARVSHENETLRRNMEAVATASQPVQVPASLSTSQPVAAPAKKTGGTARATLENRKRELERTITETRARIGQVNSAVSSLAKASVDVRIVAAPGLLGNRDRYYAPTPGTTIDIQRGDFRTQTEKDAAIAAAKRPLPGLLADLKRAEGELADVKKELLAQSN